MSRVCIRDGRFHFCTVVVATAFLVLLGRLFFLHVLVAEEFASEALSSRSRIVKVEARRGNVLDREGNLLAGTHTRISLGIDPHTFDPEDRDQLAVLAGILKLPLEEVREKAFNLYRKTSTGKTVPVRWEKLAEIDEDLYSTVEKLDIPGVYGNRKFERYYPGKEMAAHLLGYLNKDNTPVMGIERSYDFYLKGQPGWREIEVDGDRQELPAYRQREVSPTDGMHVQLTLDLYVQSMIEDAIKELVANYNPEGATIIVSHAESGEILGLGNYPEFDPNEFWEYPLENQRNRAVTDVFEPGSTFKIIPVAGALEDGLVTPQTQFDCDKSAVEYRGRLVSLPQDHKDLGEIPVYEIVAQSSNRGAAQIGMALGGERLYEYSHQFGFGRKTEWLLGGEVSGTLHKVKNWDGLTISRLPTGYAVNATPLQVHLAMSTIARGGKWQPPKLIQRILNERGEPVLNFSEREKRRVVSEDTAQTVAKMLTGVVSQDGTARRAELPGYQVAGKTGTSRKIIAGQYSRQHHFSSFSGFFPASDPEVVITVVVDDAKLTGPAYGGMVAAPVFRRIGERLIPHLAIQKPQEFKPIIVSN